MATLASSQGLTSMPSLAGARPPSWRVSMSAQPLARPLSIQPFASGLNPSRPVSMQPLASGVNHTRPISFLPFATTVNQPRPELGQTFDPAELCRRLKMHERQQKDEEEKKRIRASQMIEEEQLQEAAPQFASIDFAQSSSSVPNRFTRGDMRRLSLLEEEQEEDGVDPACEPSSSKAVHTVVKRAQHIESAAASLEGPSASSNAPRRIIKTGRHTTFDFSAFGNQTRRPISQAPRSPGLAVDGHPQPFGKNHARSLSTGDASRGANVAEAIEQKQQRAEAAKKPRFSFMHEEGSDWNQGEDEDESMKIYPTNPKRHSKFKELFVPPSVWFVNKSSSTLTSPEASASLSAAPTYGTRKGSSVSTAPTTSTSTGGGTRKPSKVRFDIDTDDAPTRKSPRSKGKRISAFFFQRATFSTTPASSVSQQQPPASSPAATSSSFSAAAPLPPAPTVGREGNERKRKSAFFKDLFRKSESGKRWKWK
ncbi:MAG: hypothetical protein M1816_002309 [Peltula sp. TS41687]|nr:MAG: hypothetical protein M1816_002309 [Peltula sp. TS41687]